MTDSVRSLLEKIIEFRVADKDNVDALTLQLLAAKALLKLDAPAKTSRKREPTAGEIGRGGGLARAEALSPERRSEIAKKAAKKRWST